MAKKEPNGSNDPLNEFNEDCNQSNSVVKQVKTEFKQDIKQEFKQEPFEAFETREQVGINIITHENFDPQSENIEMIQPSQVLHSESNDKDGKSPGKSVKLEIKTELKQEIKQEPFGDFE